MHEAISVDLVADWASEAVAALGATRAEIDALNVFPVPDGDTGTNLFLTMESAAQAVDDYLAGSGIGTTEGALAAFASGALLGARGNSGVIMSQVLRGFAEGVRSSNTGSEGQRFATGLARASELADQAVAKPKEGTILTVARDAARNVAEQVSSATNLSAAVQFGVTAAADALAHTTDQLPALREAGVVDSGGMGFVVLLEALEDAIAGRSRERIADAVSRSPIPHVDSHTVAYGGPGYEVMFLLETATDDSIPALKQALGELGDSLVVVGGAGLWNVHVHTDDIGGAIEAGIDAGRPYRIKVTHLELAQDLRRTGEGAAGAYGSRQGRGMVAVSHGPGVSELLQDSGVVVVPAQPGRRPSTAELLDGVARAEAAEVIILPSDGDTRVVAEAAAERARDDGIRTAVIPTNSVVQTLAAIAVAAPSSVFDDDIVSMGRAAAATRYGAVTVAVRRAMTSAGMCEVGDALGLVDGDIVEVEPTLERVVTAVLSRMTGDGCELATLVYGADASTELRETVESWISEHRPDLELEVIDGGQPLWPLILGVE